MNADRKQNSFNLRLSAFICGFTFLVIGCEKRREVVLYTSVDQPVAAPIVKEFEKETGIHVILVTDTEATKSVGLAEKLRAEKDHPQADVWWSNEPFHTINLADEGVLAAYDSPAAKDIPEKYKDANHCWAGAGLRLRVFCYSGPSGTELRSPIHRLEDLADPKIPGTFAMALPTAGTTGGHVAAMYILWGDQRADTFFRALHERGIKLLGGNSVVAELTANGAATGGLTDNDDAAAVQPKSGWQFASRTFDRDNLAMPTTVGLVRGAPHANEAKELVDFLLGAQVEQRMIDARFVVFSVRSGAISTHFGSPLLPMNIDYHVVAKKMPEAVRRATAILEGRE